VLMSKCGANSIRFILVPNAYMTQFAVAQRVVLTNFISVLGTFVRELYTEELVIQQYLHQLIASQQVLLSFTFLLESMAAACQLVESFGSCTTLSTLFPCCYSRVPRMSRVYGVEELSLCFLDGS
jgi:hypothetical protein